MKLFSLILLIFAAAALVPTAASKPLARGSAANLAKPATLGKPRSVPQTKSLHPPRARRETNASRFARGLPPLPPAKSRLLKGSPVRRTGASPLPSITYRGVIAVYNMANGNLLGYISSVGSYGLLYSVQSALDANALRVQFAFPGGMSTTATNVNIVAENSKLTNAANAPYVGLATFTSGTGAVTSDAAARMVGTSQSPAGSAAVSGASTWSSGTKIESAIWTVDVSSWSMTIKWVNPDNNLAPGAPFATGDGILFGDRIKWGVTGTYAISFKYVPL